MTCEGRSYVASVGFGWGGGERCKECVYDVSVYARKTVKQKDEKEIKE